MKRQVGVRQEDREILTHTKSTHWYQESDTEQREIGQEIHSQTEFITKKGNEFTEGNCQRGRSFALDSGPVFQQPNLFFSLWILVCFLVDLFLRSSLLTSMGKQWKMAHVLGICIHEPNLEETPGTWLQISSSLAILTIQGSDPVDGKCLLSLSFLLSVILPFKQKGINHLKKLILWKQTNKQQQKERKEERRERG